MPKSALDALLLPGSLASGFCTSGREGSNAAVVPYAHSSTTAASAVASASSNVNRRLPLCGFADAPARLGPGFLQASCRLVFFFCAGYWRAAPLLSVVSCRWMLEMSGNVPDRMVVWLVNLPIISGTKDLKSQNCDAWISPGDRWACCMPGAPFFLVQWTGFARGGLHVVDCDVWTSWIIGLHWLRIRSGLDARSHSS